MSPRTYLYKLTSDRGGAPCAPPPRGTSEPLLTLSLCKPAIRRTAQPGDRILGITSHSLVQREGYPSSAVIYAAVITGAVEAREYYAQRSRFRARPDCIYAFHRATGTLTHTGQTPLHAEDAYRPRDIGQYPYYRNGRTLLSVNFRYFGSQAVPLSQGLSLLRQVSETLGQGHRVYVETSPEAKEIDNLFRSLWKLSTRHTAWTVTKESYGHAPRQPASGSANALTSV